MLEIGGLDTDGGTSGFHYHRILNTAPCAAQGSCLSILLPSLPTSYPCSLEIQQPLTLLGHKSLAPGLRRGPFSHPRDTLWSPGCGPSWGRSCLLAQVTKSRAVGLFLPQMPQGTLPLSITASNTQCLSPCSPGGHLLPFQGPHILMSPGSASGSEKGCYAGRSTRLCLCLFGFQREWSLVIQ